MSLPYELECHCHIGFSDSLESVGGIDALLTNEEAALFAEMEAVSALSSSCRSKTPVTSDVIFVIGSSGPDRYPPVYNVHVDFEVELGDTITVDDDIYEVVDLLESIDGKISIRLDGGPTFSCGQTVSGVLTRYFCIDTPPYINTDFHPDVTLETSSAIEDDDIFLYVLIESFSEIEDGATVDHSISQGLEAVAEIESDFLDKFHGDFPEYFDLSNYANSQKLYPSGDVIPDNYYDGIVESGDFIGRYGASGVDTVAKCGLIENVPAVVRPLSDYIDEGVFIGKYTTHNEYSELVADDICTYITPYTNHTEGEYQAKFYLDQFTLKPLDSRLLLRLSAPINNIESELAPRYTIKDIKFEDPSGTLVVQYEDLVFLGDASDDRHPGMWKNFTTYSLKPSNNVVANKYQWQDGYPDLQKKNGYTLSFNVLVESRDDAFDDGFTDGFVDVDADGNKIAIQPTNNLRISTIEIWNSGFPGIGPSPENYMPLIMMNPEKGKRLERKIFPKFIPEKGWDTTIFPESGNLLWEDHDREYSNIDTCDNAKLISYITDNNNETYISTHDVVNDSGKLILKFGTGASPVSEVFPGAFNWAFDQSLNGIWTSPTFSDGRFHPSGAFDTENTRILDQVDNIYHDIDSISLSVTARKEAGARDFFLDVVGYSDDCILNVTSPTGGFLQHPSGTPFFTPPTASGYAKIDDLGIDGEAISDKSAYFENQASGDHYELTTYPLVDSEEFRTYELPLKIFQDEVELGLPRDYNWSTFFENLYLDIFPLPSGASISNIHLIVRYKPQNAFTLSTQGGDIGRIKPGRSEGAFFPSAMASGDDYLNTGSGFQPMSRLEDVPHQYRSPDTLKTNYARRWRGIQGLTYGPFDVNEFGFGFFNPQLDTPFIDCLIDFSRRDGDTFYSRTTPISSGRSTVYTGTTLELYQNIGLRFSSGTLFEDLLPGYSGDYRTADWTSLSSGNSNFQDHELYGQVFDAYDNIIRMDSGDNLQFNDVDPSSGIAIYTRFIPDVNVSGDAYNFYNKSNLFYTKGSPSEVGLQVGFSGGYLSASGGSEEIYDTIPYSGYQYPLTVLVTYSENYDNKIRLYTDNELHKGEFTNLRATSNPVVIPGYNQLTYGCSESLGIPMLLAEIGFTLPLEGSGSQVVESNPDRNLKQISATEFFDNQRMKFFDPEESHTNDTFKLWDYVNEDSYHDWTIGAFRNPVFSPAFDTLTKRTNRDLISFHIENDGVAYGNRTDLTFPENVDSGVSYHSQIENDFVRFHLTDSSDNFYAIYPRVRKDLPQGYKFTDRALVVDTILTNYTSGNIQWDRCTSGPKLIVSLYTKNQEPYWKPENYGLINRSIHYIEHCPSSIIKIESTFNHDDLCDDSEKWAFFPDEQKVKDFGERLFSDDIDDMFLQYDIVYPSSDGYISTLQIHTAHVKAENAFVVPTDSSGTFELFTSGSFVESGFLDLNIFGVSGYLQESGFTLNVSGEQLIPQSGSLDLFVSGLLRDEESLELFTFNSVEHSGELNLFTSGELPEVESGILDLFVHGKNIITSEIPSDSGGGSIFGMPLSVVNYPISGEELNNSLTLNLLTSLSSGVGSDYNSFWDLIRARPFDLMLFNDHLAGATSASPYNNSIDLYTLGEEKLESNFRVTDAPLFISGSGRLFVNNDMPLYLESRIVEPGSISGSMPLTVYNVHGGISSLGGGFNWDSYDYGVSIDARDNIYSRLSLDNEIRGVNTVGYGVCEHE